MYKEVCSCGASMEMDNALPVGPVSKAIIMDWRDHHYHTIVVEDGFSIVNPNDDIKQITQTGS